MSENKIVERKETEISVMPGFGGLENFEFTQRVATLLSKSSLVPKEFQSNIPNCAIALNMANRMEADPLMVMQNLYIVHGKPGWSSQFLISTFNSSGKFTSIRYEWSGKEGQDSWGCQAWAYEKETGDKLEGPKVTIKIAKDEGWYNKNGSKWKTMPQQMLMYRAAAWFIRAYAPEIAMGMHAADEIKDIDMEETQPDVYVSVQEEIKENANAMVIDVSSESEAPEEPATTDPTPEQPSEGPGF